MPDKLIAIRQRRVRRTRTVALLAALRPVVEASAIEAAAIETKQPLHWNMLHEVPEWCHWPSVRRERLVLIAGALFVAPAMRLWIEAKRIETARTLLGAEVFEQVMAFESVPREAPPLPADEDVRELLPAAGAGVLLGSLTCARLRDWLAPLLPQPTGPLPHALAAALAADTLALMVALEQPVVPAQTTEQAQQPPEVPPAQSPIESPTKSLTESPKESS